MNLEKDTAEFNMQNESFEVRTSTFRAGLNGERLPKKVVKANHASRVREDKATYESLLKKAEERKDLEYVSPFELLRRRLGGQRH